MPIALKRTLFVVLCSLVLLVCANAAAAQTGPQAKAIKVYLPLLSNSVQSAEERDMAAAVLRLINAERAKAGCGPLVDEPRLVAAAQRHSADMASNNFFDHKGSSGSDVVKRVETVGYSWSRVGENIAAGFSTPEAVVKAWLESDGHRQNIFNCAYTQTGIGYVFQTDDAPLADASWPFYRYWTQVFAAPR